MLAVNTRSFDKGVYCRVPRIQVFQRFIRSFYFLRDGILRHETNHITEIALKTLGDLPDMHLVKVC